MLGQDDGDFVGLTKNTIACREVGGVSALAAIEFGSEEGFAGCALGDLVGSLTESY